MLDYKSIVRLKRLGLNNSAIANSLGCKWDTILWTEYCAEAAARCLFFFFFERPSLSAHH